MLRRFGFIPLSTLKLSRGALSASLFNMLAERNLRMRAVKSQSRLSEKASAEARAKGEERMRRGLLGGVGDYTGTDREKVSMMSGEIVEFFAKYYSRSGALYLDPFAGQGVQMQVAHKLGMSYLGVDVCHEYVEYMHAVQRKLGSPPTINVLEADSREPHFVVDNSGDFCFTSPPYWDIEYYGPEAQQLGTDKSYDEFLQGMLDVFAAWLPKFKSGAYVVVNVNDLRRDGAFIPYHCDIVSLLKLAGYVVHDIWIVEGLIAGLPRAFAVSFNMQRIAPKVHEFAIVARVP